MIRWRGWTREEQVANARQDFVDLTPVSDLPAQQVLADWAALLPGQPIPLIGEDRGREDDEAR